MIYLLAFISILLGAVAQYFLKMGMTNWALKGSVSEMLRLLFHNYYLWSGILCYGVSMLFWLYVLSRMELSKAYPMVSLGYVITLLIGYFLLNEPLSYPKVIGIVLIVAGVCFIARGECQRVVRADEMSYLCSD